MIPLTMFAGSTSSSSGSNFVGIKYYITLPTTFFQLRSTGSVNYTVDWGDGNTQTSTSASLSHTYSSAGSYVVTITPTGTYKLYWNNNSHGERITACEISTDATWNVGTLMVSAFYGASNMTTLTINESATANATNFAYAWRDCSSLVSFPSLDLSGGTNIFCYSAWRGCSSLTTFPPNMFDSTGTLSSFLGLRDAWRDCALTAQSIENILTSLDTNGQSNILTHVGGGTNAAKSTWTTAANTAYTNLINKGWTISHNV